MQVKEVKPLTFFYHSIRTNLPGITPQLGTVARELYRDAAAHDLVVTGPVYWQYVDVDLRTDQAFTLEIALPVAEAKAGYAGPFSFRRQTAFKCVSAIHEGDWQRIPETYYQLFAYLGQQGFTPTGTNREVYLNADFNEPAANVTEIQIGIA